MCEIMMHKISYFTFNFMFLSVYRWKDEEGRSYVLIKNIHATMEFCITEGYIVNNLFFMMNNVLFLVSC